MAKASDVQGISNSTASSEFDVVVLGSGGAALAAAVTAACSGLKVAVLERDKVLGGTSAISGGALWIPGTRQAIAGNFDDSIENARTYLRSLLGPYYRPEIIDSFLKNGPEALAFLEDHSELRYSVRTLSPDYHPDLPGATDRGRALEMGEFDGKKLGPYFKLLRPPVPALVGLGGMMINRMDFYHYVNMKRSPRSFFHIVKLVLRFFFDRLRYPRGTRLVVGNAMVAALLKAALDKGVEFHLGAETQSFITGSDGSVRGVVSRLADGRSVEILARGGVVLATGGLSRRAGVLNDRPDTREDHLSMAAPLADGSMISLAQKQLGAQVGESLDSNFYWAPMSELAEKSGAREVFPHIVTDRAKPGIIAITEKGKRFTNEADSYHRFVISMRRERRQGVSRFYLLADRRALNAYGLGLVRPRPGLHGRFLVKGYLIEALSIPELARKLTIDPPTLDATVQEFNRNAAAGVDPLFGKGRNSYNRSMGDASAKNPCLAPLDQPPFYAVRIVTGDLGSAKGLVTDGDARVLNSAGNVIPGLYAVGTDMNSPIGGTYPGAGIVLGTGLTFGYVAAKSIAARLGSASAAQLRS